MTNRILLAALLAVGLAGQSVAAGLAAAPAEGSRSGETSGFDGVVEAVRQTVIAAQVPGAVVAIDVKAGDTVRAGQVLVRLDARAAEQTSAAGDAQVQAARAALEVATKDFERQKQLARKAYISQAAFERAEAQYKSTQATLNAQIAQAGAARTQSGFFVARAPYDGVVADVPVSLGDMAMPGRALVVVYDPRALRVTASVPQSASAQASAQGVQVELPGQPADRERIAPASVQVLPTVDAATHTVQVRLGLPAGIAGVTPGMFARAWLPAPAGGPDRVFVPSASVVRRAELSGIYVIDDKGKPMLRQVRVGRTVGDRTEILAGVAVGERVALDPQAAARVR
jgi:membrane fusion protein, multidrug efflux system